MTEAALVNNPIIPDLTDSKLPVVPNNPKVVIDKIFQALGATKGLTASGGFNADSFIASPVKIGSFEGGYYIDRFRGRNLRLAHSLTVNKRGDVSVETSYNRYIEPVSVLKGDLRRLLDGLRETSNQTGSNLNHKLQGREVNWNELYNLIDNMNQVSS